MTQLFHCGILSFPLYYIDICESEFALYHAVKDGDLKMVCDYTKQIYCQIKKRIKMAENLLKYSDFSAIDIRNDLCFHSHSHFYKGI